MKAVPIEVFTQKYINDLSIVKEVLRDKYVSIIEKGKVIFFVVDQAGRIRYVSDYIQDILKYKPQHLTGVDITSIIEPASLTLYIDQINKLRENPSSHTTIRDLGVFCTECERHYFDGLITFNDAMPEGHFVMYLHDVTERKKNEDSLIQTNLELDSFIYKASHDLRAPLASLTGLINLTEKSSQRQSKEYVELMKRSVNRLDQYIRKLAHYTRNNVIEVDYQEINFRLLLEEIFETYRFMPGADRIKFTMTILNKGKVGSDLFRLQLIFNNLISNAIKYHNPEESSPFISVKVVSNAKYFRIKVYDNGIGIQEEYQERVFEMFQRATTTGQGSGIGLYIVKKALVKLKGKIEVKSKLGRGTEFIITCPNQFEECIPMQKSKV